MSTVYEELESTEDELQDPFSHVSEEQTLRNMSEEEAEHPDGLELHNYFSKIWGARIDDDERARIEAHVGLCPSCALIGKAIEADDQALESVIGSPESAEDKDNTQRSISVFRARLQEKAKNLQALASAATVRKNDFESVEVDSSLMTLELADVIWELAEAVRTREISRAISMVDKTIDQLETISLLQPGAFHLLAYCAWSLDYRIGYFDQVSLAVARFRQVPKKELSLPDLALLNLAEGLVRFHQEDYVDSAESFRQAQIDADRAEDAELMTVVRYYRGRALWKLGSYDQALVFIEEAISRDLAAKNQARVAAMEMIEGWLRFVKGDTKTAQRVLARARARFGNQPDAWLDLGNILSFQGRLFREAGPDFYPDALDCYSEAILIYKKHDPSHRNLARTHLNAAFVYRLMARDLGSQRVAKAIRKETAVEVERLQQKAFDMITQARNIYELARNRHSSGLSGLHSLLALLFFDRSDFDKAEKAAAAAFAYSIESGNKIGVANARIIQSQLVLERGVSYKDVEEALKLAREAVKYAEETENRRAIARAYIREGHALLELPEVDLAGAQRSLNAAQCRLVAADRDYLRGSLTLLEDRLKQARRLMPKAQSQTYCMSIDRLRREISSGLTLGDMSEEYEEWIARFAYSELCEGNITRTADQLKTGARKIRKAITVFSINDQCLEYLSQAEIGERIHSRLETLKNREVQGRASFVRLLRDTLEHDLDDSLKEMILVSAEDD
jgi:tetratricopeptide (TPR) repeat protein